MNAKDSKTVCFFIGRGDVKNCSYHGSKAYAQLILILCSLIIGDFGDHSNQVTLQQSRSRQTVCFCNVSILRFRALLTLPFYYSPFLCTLDEVSYSHLPITKDTFKMPVATTLSL